jgi:GNAT superfamily N-acetyltransferase
MSAPYEVRRYAPADFDAVAALAVLASASAETACGQPDVASTAEFEADYGHRALEREGWVAIAADAVVGFAAGQLRNGVVLVDGPIVAPGWRGRGVGTALFARVEADAAEAGAEAVETGVRATNTRGEAFLMARGYAPNREIFVYEAYERVRSEAPVPPGYTLVDLKPRHLVPFLMLLQECFPGYRLPSTPQRLFEPDKMKIFLVLDGQERVAGAITAFYYPEDELGYIYHLGVSEPHRRRGLARVLLGAACDWLWDDHAPKVIGASTSDELGARRALFEPFGFALRYALRYARKGLPSGARA